MRNIKVTIEYDGARYLGWQRLGNSDKTIQGKIEKTISQMTGVETEIVGSGRTDAGTHARGQVANFKTECMLSLEEMMNFFVHYLPKDIIIKEIEEMPERFHARYNAKAKQYSYYVWNAPIASAFERNYSFHVPQELSFEKMEEACTKLLGTHDFLGFSALKKSKKSTVRTIDSIDIVQNGDHVQFIFIGEGFLHKMVRIMMGTIIEIGMGRLSVDVIDQLFQTTIRSEAGETVPAHGLFLDEVFYA